jgi:hypothetical protein
VLAINHVSFVVGGDHSLARVIYGFIIDWFHALPPWALRTEWLKNFPTLVECSFMDALCGGCFMPVMAMLDGNSNEVNLHS